MSTRGKYIRKNKTWNVGTMGEGEYTSRINSIRTKEYIAWDAMLQRCYDPKLHKRHPSYEKCTVCDEWLDFQNFAKWFSNNNIEGFQLDKDLLIQGNKVYSPETCCFIPQEINLALIKPITKQKYPLGVHKHSNKFVANIKENKVSKYIGIFSTIEEAANCYKQEKEKQLVGLAIKYKELLSPNSYNALLNYKVGN